MLAFNVNQISGKWIIGTDNTTNSKNGLKDWSSLGSILNIPSVIDGHNIEEIGNHAFFGCTGIEEVVIGNGIKQINEWCFSYCENLKSIVIPSSVEFIGYCSIHCYNGTAASKYGPSTRECTTEGTLIVTFLPDSKISFIGGSGISRKENIIIYYFGRNKHVTGSGSFGISYITSLKVYSPYVSRFIGIRTYGLKLTRCLQRKMTSVLLNIVIVTLLS